MAMPFTSTMTVMSMTLLHVNDEGYGSDLHVDADVMAVTFTSTMTVMTLLHVDDDCYDSDFHVDDDVWQ